MSQQIIKDIVGQLAEITHNDEMDLYRMVELSNDLYKELLDIEIPYYNMDLIIEYTEHLWNLTFEPNSLPHLKKWFLCYMQYSTNATVSGIKELRINNYCTFIVTDIFEDDFNVSYEDIAKHYIPQEFDADLWYKIVYYIRNNCNSHEIDRKYREYPFTI